jgi:hypothetical protein
LWIALSREKKSDKRFANFHFTDYTYSIVRAKKSSDKNSLHLTFHLFSRAKTKIKHRLF